MCFLILLHMTEIEKKFKETCISILNDNMSDEIFVDYSSVKYRKILFYMFFEVHRTC